MHKKDHVNKFEKFLGSRHRNISFKKEKEKDSVNSFLDVLISKSDIYNTSIYRKPTFSGIYLNFNSYVPLTYKKGFMLCLLYRAFRICSDWNLIHEEIKHLKSIWINNKYPIELIDFCVNKFKNKFLNKLFQKTNPEIDSPKKEIRITLAYIGKNTNALKKNISNLLSKVFPKCKPIFVFKSGRKIGSFFNFKDKVPFNVRSFVIYKYTCGDCNATYIGKTKRHLKVRMSEHLGISLRTGKQFKFNKNNATAIRNHCEMCQHKGSFKDFRIIGTAKNDFELLIKESILIGKESPILNRQVKSFQLELF